MERKTQISILIPAQDEADNLMTLVPEICKVLNENKQIEYNILVLNHGSLDNTSQIINEFKAQGIKICEKYYSRSKFKLGQVLFNGICQTKSDFIITMDGDNSHQPCSLKNIIDAWREGFDFIIGVRYDKNQASFKPRQRYLISTIFNFLARIIIRTGFSDYTSGYRGFSKILFNQIQNSIKSKGFEFHLELNGKLSKIANNPTAIQIQYTKRNKGTSKLRYGKEIIGYLKAMLWCSIYKK